MLFFRLLRIIANRMPKKNITFAVMKKILYILALVPLVLSCAQSESFPTEDLSLVTFKRWMENNAPQATPFNEKGTIYIEYFHKAPAVADSLKLKNGMWMNFGYTGYTMNGTSFATRDSLVSRVAGKWVNTTHWVYDYRQFANENGNITLCEGLTEVFPTLNNGDHVRVYLSEGVAFFGSGISLNSGYKGETSDYIEFPCYVDIKMGTTLTNPLAAQSDSIVTFAKKKWGQEPKDSIMKNVFMRKLVVNPTGDSIKADSTVRLYYKQTFLDGFLIKTVSDSIAKAYGRYVSTETYSYIQMKPNSEDTSYPKFFSDVLLKMQRGETVEVVVDSERTLQGVTGDATGTPQIQPYTPTVFTLIVLTKAQEKHMDK